MKPQKLHDVEWVMVPSTQLKEMNEKIEYLMNRSQTQECKGCKALDDLIDEEEAQRILRRKGTTLYNMRIAGKIEFTTSGSKVLYSLKSIQEYLKRNKRSAA